MFQGKAIVKEGYLTALRVARTLQSSGHSECDRFKEMNMTGKGDKNLCKSCFPFEVCLPPLTVIYVLGTDV